MKIALMFLGFVMAIAIFLLLFVLVIKLACQ